MSIIECEAFSIDTDTKNCLSEGKEVSLTKNEYSLLLLLANNANKVLSREEISKELPIKSEGRAIDTTVSRLRKKLGQESISTKVGFGYSVVAKKG
ncbi:winged helix-turn-helix domain-containing protein [Intestinibacter sp.]|uniref:winged helix-turn-helix domain-containing protein n=1 Tax=Intestinibacter sp. TaxID=1965304 RepID=UPI003F179A38